MSRVTHLVNRVYHRALVAVGSCVCNGIFIAGKPLHGACNTTAASASKLYRRIKAEFLILCSGLHLSLLMLYLQDKHSCMDVKR